MPTFSTTIAASADDAREAGGAVVLDGAIINITAATHYLGLRFPNVTVPAGSTINTTTVTVTVPAATHDDPDLTIWAEDVDDAATFAATSNNISGRTATTATATWSASSIGTGAKTSPDLAAIVQEVINRAGWASGNDLVIIFKGNSTNQFRINAYDNGSADYATINIDYTAGGGSTQPPRTMHQFRQRSA